MLLLLFFLLTVNGIKDFVFRSSDGKDICDKPIEPYSVHREHILQKCINDTACSDTFLQKQDNNDIALFEHLISPNLLKLRYDYAMPLKKLFCSPDVTLDDITNQMTLYYIMANRHVGQPICGVNHIPRFTKNGNTECVLKEDKDASENQTSTVTFFLVGTIVVFVMIVVVIVTFIK